MRQIKFRALAVVNDKHNNIKVGDFVYGQYIVSGVDAPCIIFGDGEQIEVDEKTVGQFIDMISSGVEVYEGDVIQYWDLYECHSDAVDYFDVEPQNNFSVDEVFFELKTGDVEFVDGAFKVNGTCIFDIARENKERIIDNHYQGSLGLPLKDFVYDCYDRGITRPLSKGLGEIKIIGNIHQFT